MSTKQPENESDHKKPKLIWMNWLENGHKPHRQAALLKTRKWQGIPRRAVTQSSIGFRKEAGPKNTLNL